MRISAFLIIVLIASCSTQEIEVQDILLLGHGGEGFDGQNTLFAPNTNGSINRALDFYRLDGVELDLQFTKDNQLVLFHDDFLENATQCKGKVNTQNLSDITTCYYRKQFYNDYKESVLSLDSLIRIINSKYPDYYFNLNIKIAEEDLPRVDSLAPILARQLNNINDISKIAIECADANFLFFVRAYDEKYVCYLVADLVEQNTLDVERFNLQGIVSFFDIRNERLEKELYEKSKSIFLYGHKTSRHYSTYNYKYISGIQVDNPLLAKNFFY